MFGINLIDLQCELLGPRFKIKSSALANWKPCWESCLRLSLTKGTDWFTIV